MDDYDHFHSETVIIGFASNPDALDPIDTWDAPSHITQHQVTQSLVEYDLLTHPDYEIKPVLAQSWTWRGNMECSFDLRRGVEFHDGTSESLHVMNADDVKWNFDRVQYFLNATGELPGNSTTAFPGSLFYFSDGTPIFKEFVSDGQYNFTIRLNAPFGALLDLLCFGATNILSPTSTPRYTYIPLATGDLVGTGPYTFKHYYADLEVRLEKFENYWGPEPFFETAVLRIIEDDTTRMTAGLAGIFDYVVGVLKDKVDTFKADSDFHVEDVGEDLCYFYLEIYCGPRDINGSMILPSDPQYQKNPAYLRRALALAINYTHIYEEIQYRYAVEGTTAVPRAMPGHNASIVQASDNGNTWEQNIVLARQILKANAADIIARGGIDISGFDVNNDSYWTGQNILGRNLELNRHFGSSTNEGLNDLMAANFDMIGIQTFETIRTWGDYEDTGEQTPWQMDIAYTGRCADYLNPFNMIDPLFNLASGSCFSRINNTSTDSLTELMNAAVAETNLNIQYNYYMKIQSLIYDVNRPLNPASHCHISSWVYLVHQIHKTSLKGVQYNVMTMIEISHWYWEA